MKRLNPNNVNTTDFWNIQYAPERRTDYIRNNLAYGKYDYAVDMIKDGQKVLDLACGLGIFAIKVKNKYPSCEVWAYDQSDSMVNDLKKEREDITWQVATIGNEDMPNDFDFVFAGDVVEHLDDPSTVFKDAFSHLKQGGKLVVTTPDGDIKPFAGSPDHVWILDHDDMDKLFSENGFCNVDYPYIPGTYGIMFMMGVGEKC